MIENKDYKIIYRDFNKVKREGVYLIRNLDTNKLKIGITNDLMRRLHEIEKSFQFCGTIPKLKIECFIEYNYNLELEQFLHKELQEFNYQNEWFSIDNINIVLEKVQYFKRKEKVVKVIVEPKKISLGKVEDYRYYVYKLKKIDIDCIVYFKRKLTKMWTTEEIENITTSLGYMWNYFSMAEWEIQELDIHTINIIEQEFLKYNTNTIAYVDNSFMRLDVYLGNILIKRKINELKNNKDVIFNTINKLINIEYDNSNIDHIKETINNIENECVKMQEYLNESIEKHHRKNFKLK